MSPRQNHAGCGPALGRHSATALFAPEAQALQGSAPIALVMSYTTVPSQMACLRVTVATTRHA